MLRDLMTHTEYRALVTRVRKALFPDPSKIPDNIWRLIKLFNRVDLTPVDELLKDRYSTIGRPAWQPSAMFRSLLMSIAYKQVQLDVWVSSTKVSPLLAAIAGFDSDKKCGVPGVSTYYDFMYRLWDLDRPHIWEDPKQLKQPKPRIKAPKKKGEKAVSEDQEDVEETLRRLHNTTFDLENEAWATLFKIFTRIFLIPAIENGHLPRQLSISGDGTPVQTCARQRSRRVCQCRENGITDCQCLRYFSQPDCDYGWDSHRRRYYCGYNAYFITANPGDLPLFVILFPASRHDSRAFCESITRLKTYLAPLGLTISQAILDSAHDAMPIYEYLQEENIQAIIDMNPGNCTTKESTLRDITINADGNPVCPAGLPMKTNGTDRRLKLAKFRCPRMSTEQGKPVCTCDTPCSDSKYGKTFSIPMTDNLRYYTSPPRGSDEWKKLYNSRTSSERTNKREKWDFLLELVDCRSSRGWYIRVYLIMMLVHAFAWLNEAEDEVEDEAA